MMSPPPHSSSSSSPSSFDLDDIINPSSAAAQLAGLKALRNELIGHEQKKEACVRHGLVLPLVRILSSSRGAGKRRSREVNGHLGPQPDERALTPDEEPRLEATIIVDSLAQAGPAFVAPLLQAAVLPALLLGLAPGENSPRLVSATLCALATIAHAFSLTLSQPGLVDGALSNLLYRSPHAQHLTAVLTQSSTSALIQGQIDMAASLIADTCREDWHQASLVATGALDALAGRLVFFIVNTCYAAPAADGLGLGPGPGPACIHHHTHPRKPAAELHLTLQAVGAIIQDSSMRAAQLLYTGVIRAFFPSPAMHALNESEAKMAHHGPAASAEETCRQMYLSSVDGLLPPLPTAPQKPPSGHSAAFPSLASPALRNLMSTWGASSRNAVADPLQLEREAASQPSAGTRDDDESLLVSWLLHLTRAERGLTRLMAASVLTALYRAGLTSKKRELSLARLVVPLLVQMLDDAGLAPASSKAAARPEHMLIRERAPAVLAMLVTDSLELQNAAVEAHAIEKLTQMLKAASEPVAQPKAASPWTAVPAEAAPASDHEPATCRLGRPGLSPIVLHRMTVRGSALKALAALALFRDDFRKSIIDAGITPLLVKSLAALHSERASGDGDARAVGSEADDPAKGDGNPSFVLIAACGAVRALSRSVSILRTSLNDAGVAMPLLALLRHGDMEVRIASTAAVCNLVLEFSPMRDAIMGAGALKILCDHAHSKDARLRLNALWALKSLVCSAENEIKMSCLEELGQGWLVQIICDDHEATTMAAERQRDRGEPSEAALGPVEVEQMKGRGPSDPACSASEGAEAKDGSMAIDPAFSWPDEESDRSHRAQRDDRAVQEQGLEFIRNLIGGPDSVDMIDFLLTNLGQERFFEILSSKLQPRTVRIPGAEAGRAGSTRTVQAHGQIIAAVCFILVHIAGSHPRHRQLLISQTELLKALLPLFGHGNKNVRVALTWIIINLTWLDDQADQLAWKGRALELRKLGFQSKLETLEHDPELDVRERTKTALSLIKQAIAL